MRKRKAVKKRRFSLKAMGEKETKVRTYRYLRISILDRSLNTRKRVFDEVLNDGNAIGFMEFFRKGGIIHKPIWQFYGILVLENKKG